MPTKSTPARSLAVGLACGDQRRLTGSGSALKALRDDALYKYTYFTVSTDIDESSRGLSATAWLLVYYLLLARRGRGTQWW